MPQLYIEWFSPSTNICYILLNLCYSNLNKYSNIKINVNSAKLELKVKMPVNLALERSQPDIMPIDKFSKIQKLLLVVAFVLRFKNNMLAC